MSGAFPNFEPIYAALAAKLLNAGTINFTGDSGVDSPVIANIPDTSALYPGLAAINDLVPIGTTILSVDSPSQITLTQNASAAQTTGAFAAGFRSTDPMAARLLRHWTDVESAALPALFLTQPAEDSEKRVGQPAKWTLDTKVYIYVEAPNDTTPTAPAMNALLAAVRIAMACDPSGPGRVQNRATLGGLVFDSWINGRIETDEGFLGQKAVAIIPIRLIANGP